MRKRQTFTSMPRVVYKNNVEHWQHWKASLGNTQRRRFKHVILTSVALYYLLCRWFCYYYFSSSFLFLLCSSCTFACTHRWRRTRQGKRYKVKALGKFVLNPCCILKCKFGTTFWHTYSGTTLPLTSSFSCQREIHVWIYLYFERERKQRTTLQDEENTIYTRHVTKLKSKNLDIEIIVIQWR